MALTAPRGRIGLSDDKRKSNIKAPVGQDAAADVSQDKPHQGGFS